MPVQLTEREIPQPDPKIPRRKLWTREELQFFEGTEVFAGTHYELIEGELIDKMGKNRPHSYYVRAMVLALSEVFDPKRIEQEATINVAGPDNKTNAPEPDILVLNRKPRRAPKTGHAWAVENRP